MTPKFIVWFSILVCLWSPVVAQQTQTPPRTVTAPVTVVAPPVEVPFKDAQPRETSEPMRVVQSGPVTFTLPLAVWIAWLLSIAAGLGAIAVIWRFVVKAATILSDFSKYGGVLIEIAKEFKSDSGSTLKDSINRIEEAINIAKVNADSAKAVADNLGAMLRDHMSLTRAREEVRTDEQVRYDDPPSRKRKDSHK